MDQAFRDASKDAGLEAATGWTNPKTWSYPLLRLGAFSLTLGVVQRRHQSAPRKLRGRPSYIKSLAARNAPLDPQASLFDTGRPVPDIIPSGAFGGLIVVEHMAGVPDAPVFIGLWIPSEGLDRAYHCFSLEQLISILRAKIAATRRPARRTPEPKAPMSRKRPKLKIPHEE